MPHQWPQGFSSVFFSPSEFDHPELMDGNFIRELDTLRMRCGFALEITDDARTEAEHKALYKAELEKGGKYPTDSGHLYQDNILVRCVDIRPAEDTPMNRMRMLYEILRMHFQSKYFTHLGLIVETRHVHMDDTTRLKGKRPYFSIDVSR